jgi:hypothetical protein
VYFRGRYRPLLADLAEFFRLLPVGILGSLAGLLGFVAACFVLSVIVLGIYVLVGGVV